MGRKFHEWLSTFLFIAVVSYGREAGYCVVIDPIRREEFQPQKGAGATLDNGKIRVSKQQGIVGSMLSFATSSVSSLGMDTSLVKAIKSF